MNNSIDLHMHSIFSDDGEFTPDELVRQCKERGISVMAIADHNCARANVDGERAALAAGITYIPAIEIDCTFQEINFHILGYGIDYDSDDFKTIEKNIDKQCQQASHRMLNETQKLGFQITENEMIELAQNSYWKNCWTGEMFAEVILNAKEYENHPLLLPYRQNGERSDNPYVNFYWDFYSQGKPCYVKMDYPPVEQVIDIIHKNSGKAVLAHPGMNLKNHNDLLEPIVQLGLDGIEAFSSYHSPEQSDYFFHKAQQYNLFVTCGSDYHGKTKPSVILGGHGCSLPNDSLYFARRA